MPSLSLRLAVAFALLLGHVLTSKVLKDVLVVVKHNSPSKPEQVKRQYEYLSQVFPHIRIYGPWKRNDLRTLKKNNLPVYLTPLDDEWFVAKDEKGVTMRMLKPGCAAYRSVLAEMEKDPSASHYAGFLFMHDDLAVDMKKLQTLNVSSAWVAFEFVVPHKASIDETAWKTRSASWDWFNQDMGIGALDKIYTAHPFIERHITKCTGHSHNMLMGKGDLFYIPNNHIGRLFRHIGAIFATYRLFLELAIPLFVECFVKPSEIVHLKFCSRSGDYLRETLPLVQRECNGSDAVHPLKLSHFSMWEIYEAVSNIK